jgi:dihydroneopterin aldolase
MTKVCLHGMNFYAFHGYYEYERKAGNHYILDVDVSLKQDSNFQSEEIEATVNYEDIYKLCKLEMEEQHQLLETVAYNVANAIKTNFNNVDSVFVRLSKLNPQLGGDVDKAVIEYSLT